MRLSNLGKIQNTYQLAWRQRQRNVIRQISPEYLFYWQPVFPLRKLHIEQMFVLVRMQLRNHVTGQVFRFGGGQNQF